MTSYPRAGRRTTAALALTILVSGCSDFLVGPKLTETPNAPTLASISQLLTAVQASQFLAQQSQLARLAAMYTQQLSGTNNQQRDWGSTYIISEGDLSGRFSANYTGGGLVDLRNIQRIAGEAGDNKTAAIAKIWEAFVIGTAASLWGDIPYSEANTDVTTPKLDPQQEVYAAIQTLLDGAITQIDQAGTGPGAVDLVYGGNADRWKRAAWTLKARFHMHTAEQLGNAAYTAARTAAGNGINEAPTSVLNAMNGAGPGDFRTFHDNTNSAGNIWAQFLTNRADMTAGAALINLLNARGNDPRLAHYFSPIAGGGYVGSDQFGRIPASGASLVSFANRLILTFRQPLITWAENQLILAETNFRLGAPDVARTHLNNVRASVGLAPLGAVTLEDIALEKYIVMFQNIEVWNDWKRNCYPRLVPGGANFTPAAEIPGRTLYGNAERNANPNIPLPAQQPARNWNDPNTCPQS